MSDNVKKIGGAIAGGIVGFMVGGPAGAYQGAMLGYSIGASFTTTTLDDAVGPRLESLEIQGADYDDPMNDVYGSPSLSGQIIWIKGNKLDETENRTTVRSGGKGGGGSRQTQISYTYSVTLAVALCRGPIAAVKRIYANDELIYDASNGSNVSNVVSSEVAENITIYDGASDNEIAPEIEADIGTSNIPAFRGVSYVLFEDFELTENYYNTIPRFTFEFEDQESSSGVNAFIPRTPTNTVTLPVTPRSLIINNDGITSFYPWWYEDGILHFMVKGTNARSVDYIEPVTGTTVTYSNVPNYILQRLDAETGSLISEEEMNIPANTFLGGISSNNYNNVNVFPITNAPGYLWISYDDSSGNPHNSIGLVQSDGRVVQIKAGQLRNSSKVTSISASQFLNGNAYVLTSGVVYKFDLTSVRVVDTPTVNSSIFEYSLNYSQSSNYGTNVYALGVSQSSGYIYVGDDSGFKELDESFNTIRTLDLTYTDTSLKPGIQVHDGGNAFTYYYFSGFNDRRVTDRWVDSAVSKLEEEIIGSNTTYSLVSYSDTSFMFISAAGAVGNYLVGYGFSDDDNILVRDAIAKVMQDNPFVTFNDVDYSSIADESLGGYVVPDRASAVSRLKPLMQAYHFDVIEEDYQLKFQSRANGSSVATITVDDLAAHEVGQSQPEQAIRTIKGDYLVPARVNVSYIDGDRDFQKSTQYDESRVTKGEGVTQINVAMAITANKAKQIANVLVRNAELESNGYVEVSTTFKYSHIERGRFVTVTTDNESMLLRVIDKEMGKPGLVKLVGALEDVTNYTSTAVGDTGNTSGTQTLLPRSQTELALIDTVPLRSSDSDFGTYYGVYPSNPGGNWDGAGLTVSDDYQRWTSVGYLFNGVTLGTCSTALTDTGLYTIFDESETLTVYMINGTLSSATEAQVRKGVNLCAYGQPGRWELIKFQTATLNGDGSYTISVLQRGYWGTEVHAGSHAVGDKLILIDEDTIRRYNLIDDSDFETTRYFQAISFGKVFSKLRTIQQTADGEARTPRAPSIKRVAVNASSDYVIEFARQKLIDREWSNADWTTDTVDFNFELDILDAPGGSVVRTLTTSGTVGLSITYTAAQQTTDTGTTLDPLYFNLYEVDPVTGRGHAKAYSG